MTTRNLTVLAAVFALLACTATAAPKSWTFYDQCAQQTSSFIAMAQCGEANRNAFCQPRNSCSAAGNAFVLYTNSLVASVENHEMTEAEAQRKWIEFRMAQTNADAARAANNAAIAGAILSSRPAPQPYMMPTSPGITCNTFGTGSSATTTCH
jgi:hypothetical protein